MNRQQLVSVIIPTYNCGPYIGQTLASICGQTYSHLEINVIDDGSEDGTREIVEQYRKKDSRVRYFWKPNGGQPSARNVGLRESKGNLVAFCDADDLWGPEKLALQIPLFDNPATGVSYTDVELFDDATGAIIPYTRKNYAAFKRGFILPKLLAYNFVTHSSVVARRSCFSSVGLFDESIGMGDDWEMLLRLAWKYQFDFCPRKLVKYRVNRRGQISSRRTTRFEAWEAILEGYITAHPQELDRKTISKARSTFLLNKAWFLRRNDPVAAITCYVRAIKNHPGNMVAYGSLAKVLVTKVCRDLCGTSDL